MTAGALASVVDQALQGFPHDSSTCFTKNIAAQRSVSFDPEHGIEGEGMSSPSEGRTFEHSSKPLNDERELAKQVSAALVVDFSHYRSTHKVIARHAGVSQETVKRWMAADSAPSLIYFMRLLPHSPSLRKLVSMEQNLDPEFQRELAAFIQRVQGMQR